ncbi:hypothetical protein RsTz2092_06570 [Deferribacterales bacterium RsTz2092]|nr:hypothetical protein AGMMS49941_03340 [Deferribacterales bacterium]
MAGVAGLVDNIVANRGNAALDSLSAMKGRVSDKERLKVACQGFEAMMNQVMLRAMREAVPDNGFIKRSSAEKIWTDMLDEKYADTMAKNNVGGLADILYKSLEPSVK